MKKIFIILVLFASLQGFSQKTVYVFNTTAFGVDIGEIDALPNSGSGYPRFKSISGLIHINAGQSYTLDNTSSATRFPFQSPASVPQILNWGRQSASGGSYTTTSSSVAYSAYGNGQKFNFIKFQVGTSGSLGGGNLGLGFPTTISGSGWSADYSTNTDPLNPNLQETVIIIY